jgi:hypothetical protein
MISDEVSGAGRAKLPREGQTVAGFQQYRAPSWANPDAEKTKTKTVRFFPINFVKLNSLKYVYQIDFQSRSIATRLLLLTRRRFGRVRQRTIVEIGMSFICFSTTSTFQRIAISARALWKQSRRYRVGFLFIFHSYT